MLKNFLKFLKHIYNGYFEKLCLFNPTSSYSHRPFLLPAFFPLYGVIRSYLFACLIIFCWKLDILDDVLITLGTGTPPPQSCYCYLLFFSDSIILVESIHPFMPPPCHTSTLCSVIPLMLRLRGCSLGFSYSYSGMTVVLAGIS